MSSYEVEQKVLKGGLVSEDLGVQWVVPSQLKFSFFPESYTVASSISVNESQTYGHGDGPATRNLDQPIYSTDIVYMYVTYTMLGIWFKTPAICDCQPGPPKRGQT